MKSSRRALGAFLLGHCGKEQHAAFLQKEIEQQMKEKEGGLDGALIGYTLLRPREGLSRMRDILGDPRQDFMQRYRALRAARFFWFHRRDVLPKADVVATAALMLDHGDAADLVIEDLRRGGEVQYLERILALDGRPGFDAPIIRRTILRFALTFKDKPAAARYIEAARAKDSQRVDDVEEFLKLEKENVKPTPKK